MHIKEISSMSENEYAVSHKDSDTVEILSHVGGLSQLEIVIGSTYRVEGLLDPLVIHSIHKVLNAGLHYEAISDLTGYLKSLIKCEGSKEIFVSYLPRVRGVVFRCE